MPRWAVRCQLIVYAVVEESEVVDEDSLVLLVEVTVDVSPPDADEVADPELLADPPGPDTDELVDAVTGALPEPLAVADSVDELFGPLEVARL